MYTQKLFELINVYNLVKEVAPVPLTPLDIHNKEFTRSFRGYDEDEVNEFLDQVIKDYELVIRESKEYQERIQKLEEKIRSEERRVGKECRARRSPDRAERNRA